jgi:2-oxo-4-hydroxy-4-carboxy-5-ureidoimidazoline decarboxylase
MPANWQTLNTQSDAEAREAFSRCCGSRRWVDGMMSRRPFASLAALCTAADDIWAGLDRSDYLDAFATHPRIGDLAALREKIAATAHLCGGEQAGLAGAGEQTIHDLADGNRQYEARFGHIFIVCATGKTAAEMLTLLRARLENDPDDEMKIAAAEQAKITRLRLEKL